MANKVLYPIITDATGQELLAQMKLQTGHLEAIAEAQKSTLIKDWQAIRKLVEDGYGPENFAVGDQIIVPWEDLATGTSYQVPLDVVHFGKVTLEDGEERNGMYLQWHYATPFGVQFDAPEAFFYAAEALPAGSYSFTMNGSNIGSNLVAGNTYYFTTTADLPAKGQLCFNGNGDQNPSKVVGYASAESTTALFTVATSTTVIAGATSLGTISRNTPYSEAGGIGNLNDRDRIGYGYNRWSQSNIRQFLNSGAGTGWSHQKNIFDRPAAESASKQGFLSGFEDEFLSVLRKVKVTTALNTMTDTAIGDREVTYDEWFLPSLEQEYINPQLSGAEGDYWEYWKEKSGRTSPCAQYSTYPNMITYAVENHTSAQYVRLRSANRGHAYGTWNVYASGYVYYYAAYNSFRCAPACVIC